VEPIFIGRQPIYKKDLQVAGYELLHRAGAGNRMELTDGDQATTEVIIGSCMDFGLEALVGDRPAFINLTRSFVLGDRPLPFPQDRIVLEVLEDIAFDPPVLAGLARLSKRGFTIALDDFKFRPEAIPALEIADMVKVDVLQHSPAQLEHQVSQLRPFGVALLAEKVESHEMFARCKRLGFEYFQGYFLCRPNLIEGHRHTSHRGALVSLLAALQKPDAELKDLEALIVQDSALTLRLLRYMNSAGMGLRRTITSIRQALMLIGSRTIQNWVTLILLAGVENKPAELTRTALVRARMCELIAISECKPQPATYFTAGLLSLLDAALDWPMHELLQQLPVHEQIKAALLSRGGELGETLQGVSDYEQGAWEQLSQDPARSALYRQCYFDALQWAEDQLKALAPESEAQVA
jgi:EAL and modified HD-GYP domain-containing signal transduction protein